MKKIMLVTLLFLGIFMMQGVVFAMAEAGETAVDFPSLTNESFTNYGWNATMEKRIVNEIQMNEGYVRIDKTAIADVGNNDANIYYQNFGDTVSNLIGDGYANAVKVRIFVPVSLSNSEVIFYFSGTEQTVVSAYDVASETALTTRSLDFTGVRIYTVTFPLSVNPLTVSEFQISLRGSDLGYIDVLGMQLSITENDPNAVSMETISFPDLTNEQFSNFGWNTDMTKSIDTVTVNETTSLKITKSNLTNTSDNSANVYYQSFGSTVSSLIDSETLIGIQLDVYVPTAMDNSGLLFKYDGNEQFTVNTYEAGNDIDLATRDLNFTGTRTYIVPFLDATVVSALNEFQIGIWGSDEGEIYLHNLKLVVEGEPIEVGITTDNDFPTFEETSFTNFGFNCDMTKTFSSEDVISGMYLQVEKLSTISVQNEANVYYQNFGSTITDLSDGKVVTAVQFAVTLQHALSDSVMVFKLNGTPLTDFIVTDRSDLNVLTDQSLDYEGTHIYKVILPETLNAKLANELQIGFSGMDLGSIYLNEFKLLITDEDDETSIPSYFEKPDFSYLYETFDSDDAITIWGISGTTGTVFNKILNTNNDYISEGTGSLRLYFQNQLYTFGYTEIYLDVETFITEHTTNGLTGFSFDLFNMTVQTVGEVGFWVKIAEADGSEYEFNYSLIEAGTKLDFTGKREVYIPFESVTTFMDYTTDENSVLDYEQIAFVKIGIWTNVATETEVELYVDNVQFWSTLQIEEDADIPVDDPDDTPNNTVKLMAIIGGSVVGVGAITGGVLWLLKKKKGI